MAKVEATWRIAGKVHGKGQRGPGCHIAWQALSSGRRDVRQTRLSWPAVLMLQRPGTVLQTGMGGGCVIAIDICRSSQTIVDAAGPRTAVESRAHGYVSYAPGSENIIVCIGCRGAASIVGRYPISVACVIGYAAINIRQRGAGIKSIGNGSLGPSEKATRSDHIRTVNCIGSRSRGCSPAQVDLRSGARAGSRRGILGKRSRKGREIEIEIYPRFLRCIAWQSLGRTWRNTLKDTVSRTARNISDSVTALGHARHDTAVVSDCSAKNAAVWPSLPVADVCPASPRGAVQSAGDPKFSRTPIHLLLPIPAVSG